MAEDSSNESESKEWCVEPPTSMPSNELGRYVVDADPHSESDIANYVHGQAQDENVLHVERIKREIVLGSVYDIWDVTTDKNRWWVITNLTNLYPRTHFPSLDYTLSFHIGLMTRLRSRETGADADDPSPFDEVFRRMDQAEKRHEGAIEAEDYQSVGMLLRESLISLVSALRRRANLSFETEAPKDADVPGWITLLVDHLCSRSDNKELRQHIKHLSIDTWQLVNWLTHSRNAHEVASSIAIHSAQTAIGHCIQVLERDRTRSYEKCPRCGSRDIRSHFDIGIHPDGDYYLSCGSCRWNDHPGG